MADPLPPWIWPPPPLWRALRIEHTDAVYHVMARGNQGQAVFQDDADRTCFGATLGKAGEKTRGASMPMC